MSAVKNPTRGVRFKSDPATITMIDMNSINKKFSATHTALLINESFKGCCVVLPTVSNLEVGEIARVKIGEMDPQDVEIRWIEKLDEEVLKIGFLFLG
jgi:hypothetical protein